MSISEHLLQFQSSGKTIKSYCEEYALKVPMFKYHLYKSTPKTTSNFVPISFSLSSPIEIQYANGIKIILSPDTPVSFIKSLIV